MERLAALLLLVALAGCGGGSRGPSNPSPAPLPATPPVKIASPIVGLGSHTLTHKDLGELRDLGIRHVRTTLYPALWESDTTYVREWTEGARRAAGYGMRLLVVVHQLPPDMGIHDFSWFMGSRAEEFKHLVESWQIGNEQSFGSPWEHSRWHQMAYDAIKANDPDALVVTLAMPSQEFARAFTADTDVFAVHVYGLDLAAEAKKRRAWFGYDAKVWVTEFGLEAAVVPESHSALAGGWVGPKPSNDEGAQRYNEAVDVGWQVVQAREWKALVESAFGYARVMGYQLRTFDGETHGVIRPNGTLRPAAVWLKSRAG